MNLLSLFVLVVPIVYAESGTYCPSFANFNISAFDAFAVLTVIVSPPKLRFVPNPPRATMLSSLSVITLPIDSVFVPVICVCHWYAPAVEYPISTESC